MTRTPGPARLRGVRLVVLDVATRRAPRAAQYAGKGSVATRTRTK